MRSDWLILIFSIIRTLDYQDYIVQSQRVRIIEVRIYLICLRKDGESNKSNGEVPHLICYERPRPFLRFYRINCLV